MAHLVAAEAAGETARDGAADAALAVLAFGLGVLGLLVGSGVGVSGGARVVSE